MLLRAGFLVIPFNAMVSPRITVLEKKLQFKNWVFLMQGSAVVGIVIAIGSAFYLHNAWALIYGYVSESLFKFLLSYIFYPLIPTFEISRDHLKEIISFTRGMYGLPIMMLLFAQMDVIVIGRVLSLELLGLYVLARSISDMPLNFFSKIAQPLLLPSFSTLQDNGEKLNKALLNITNIMATLAIPLFAFLIVFSDMLLSLFYGNIYATMAVPFGILCVYSFVYLCTTIIMSGFISIGKPNLQRVAAIVRTLLFLIIIYPAVKIFGLSGAAASLLIASIVSLVVQQHYLNKIMTVKPEEYCGAWVLGAQISLIVIIPGIMLRLALDSYNVTAVAGGAILCILSWGVGLSKIPLVREKLLTVNPQVP
jgi:O-antigen/teichoic acid export membrane protein